MHYIDTNSDTNSTLSLQWLTKKRSNYIGNKTADLEAAEHNPIVVSHAVQLLKRLETYDADYRNHHMDALESDEAAVPEQEELDRHDEDVTDLTVRLSAAPAVTDGHALALRQLQAKLSAIGDDITTDPNDVPLVYTSTKNNSWSSSENYSTFADIDHL